MSAEPRPRPANGRSPIDWDTLFRVDLGPAAAEVVEAALGDGQRADDALDAWAAARGVLERAEMGLLARGREIAVIQGLAQRASDAGDACELFRKASDVLLEAGDVDLVVAVHRADGPMSAEVFPAGPVREATISRIVTAALRFLDCSGSVPVVQEVRPAAWDEHRRPVDTVRDGQVVLLPVLRRGVPVACLAVVHAVPPDGSRERVLYGAANHLSLHLDRILTVREAEQDRFRSILDSMSHAVILADRGMRVVHTNPAASEVLAGLRVNCEGGRIDDALGEDFARLARGLLEGSSGTAEIEVRVPAGQVYEVTASTYRGRGRGPEGLVVVLEDVTQRRALEEQLTQAEKMTSLGQMLSGVAHELNNPLASILGYAQLARATASNERSAARLAVLEQEAQRCRRIVANLLAFARRKEPERRPVSLRELVEAVVGLVSYPLRVDSVTVETVFDPAVPAVLADPHDLQQTLLNLVTNAHHAIRSTGRAGTVRIETRALPDGRVAWTVEDDGPGIDPAVRPRIFEPFVTTKPPGEGTGLGLALAYSTIASHGGTVTVSDGSRGGARFEILLPAMAAPQPEPCLQADCGEPALARTRGVVLVVEDEPAIGRLVREALEEDGHRVIVALDGGDALARLSEERCDLIVLDWRLPHLGGHRLYDEIRARWPALADRIVLTTGDALASEPETVAGRDGVPMLLKPFDVAELRRTVQNRLV